MSRMLSVAPGFQYSVNIGYDLNSEEKLKNFIPTQSALSLLEEVLLSTSPNSTERSRILIGAYGKGKSHIVLMILSILMKRTLSCSGKPYPRLRRILSFIKVSKTIMTVAIVFFRWSSPAVIPASRRPFFLL